MPLSSSFLTSLSLLFFSTFAARTLLPPETSPPPSAGLLRRDANPFKPSVVVVVGVLTTMFSITFLLLLYAKHCKRVNVTYSDDYSYSTGGAPFSSSARKNSGIDRTVIDSLPIFRFSSLIGQKDGLECAVCLSRFQRSEVLRLLPKCKHAFHVECVDTWLDAHSTCPLCRYRVDPEDILLVDKMFQPNPIAPPPQTKQDAATTSGSGQRSNRVIGRHSSAGEGGTSSRDAASYRRSLDSLGQKRGSESVSVGCFDRGRKDGLLLSDGPERSRLEHRIVISGRNSRSGVQVQEEQRWSDVQPSDLLYLQSEMIISESSRGLASAQMNGRGRSVINERSVSEITGMSRLKSDSSYGKREREAGAVRRWLAWIASQSRPHDSQAGRTSASAAVPAPAPAAVG